MKKNKKTATAAAFCMLIATEAPSLAAEPSQPEPEQATATDGANPAPNDSETKPNDQAGDSGAAGESADDEASPAKDYRHRPGACPEGPPCKSE